MSAKVVATCVGCGQTDKQTGEYDKHNPVTEDGSYENGHFVCTACYVRLIHVGRDIGTPAELQKAMRELVAAEKKA